MGPGVVPLLPLASDRGPQGFVRVINHSDQGGAVRVDVFDDAGQAFGPLTLSLGPGETRHFNSDDLENGNSEKGLSGGVGPGTSAWRLELSSALDIEVLSYFRTPDGFLTAMHDIAPAAGNRHRIAIFNPGSNRDQQSILRLVNPGAQTAQVVIEGVDDSGRSPDGPGARIASCRRFAEPYGGGAGIGWFRTAGRARRRRRQVASVRGSPIGRSWR